MISNKKSHAMKMLQLALVLSLLHVDPDQRLRNWDSHLELRDGDGWELEMLRAVPMVEYPYANRKTMMPLIEDLIRFDRENNHHENQYNVTAYLLNVSNENSNETAAMQEMQSLSSVTTNVASSAVNSATAPTTSLDPNSVTVSSVVTGPGAANSSFLTNTPSLEIELFLNSENFQDQRSVWEQNLADLNDFNDLPIMNTQYGNLPLKDGQQDNNLFDLQLEAFLPTIGSSAFTSESEVAVALNDTFPTPDDGAAIKLEQLDDEEYKPLLTGIMDVTQATTLSTDQEAISQVSVKKEEGEENTNENATCVNDNEVDLSPFINSVELTKQSKYEPENDDVNTDDRLADEWSGIPFTIDNETGEYIRLPLDEILNDVIQFAELASAEDEDQDSGASTSKAAAAGNTNFKLEKEQADGDGNSTSFTKTSTLKKKSASETDFGNTYESDSDFEDDVNSECNDKKYRKENVKNNCVTVRKEKDEKEKDNGLSQAESEDCSLPSPLFDLDDDAKEELADLSMMLHSSAPFATHHHHHHHPHPHPRTGGGAGSMGSMQNYGVVNSAFHRQPSSGGFHHGHHQGRMPTLSRAVSMEHRFQDIASLLNPMGVVGGVSDMSPYSHYSTHPYSYQSGPQHAQYPPPPPPPHPHHHHHHAAMMHPNASLGDLCSTQPHYGHNLGSAVTSSMHLTNSSHDSDVSGVGAGAVGGAYKMEHDMMYYSNASSDMNHTTDGFINSILNEEDLHLMDMNVNDSFCRMVDVNNSTSNNSSVLGISSGHANTATAGGTGSSSGLTMSGSSVAAAGGPAVMTNELLNTAGGQTGTDRLDASSDSAVSSMGSERVPSLSDGEWGEGSDSAQDYHQGKYGGPYDYSYNNTAGNNRLSDGSRQQAVPQKKHHMFGKRFLNEHPGVAATHSANSPNAPSGTLNGPAHSIKYEYEAYPSVASLHENLGNGLDGGAIGGPIINKEHHAYGGAYSLDFSVRTPRTGHDIVQHNHSYTLPQGTGSLPRPQQRDKKVSTSSLSSKSSKSAHNSSGSGGEEDNYMTRDEKRARAMNIPIPVTDIINLPMDEFNERLSKYDLSENQLSLIRDIRRRGKNKVAAQNCRKRKLDQILSLEDEVKQVRRRKDDLQAQHERLFNERKRVSNKFGSLHRHIFQYLRDAEGNPCSPSEYSLQQAVDGSIFLLPRDAATKNDTANCVLQHNSTANGSSQPIHHQQIAPSNTNTHIAGHHLHHMQEQASTVSNTTGHVQTHHHAQQSQPVHQPVQSRQPHHAQGGSSTHQQKD